MVFMAAHSGILWSLIIRCIVGCVVGACWYVVQCYGIGWCKVVAVVPMYAGKVCASTWWWEFLRDVP